VGFLNTIGRYQLSALIKLSSSLSQRLWNGNESVATLFRMDSSRFIRGAFKKVGSTYLTPWFLVDIIYHGIVNSSDFAIALPSENDLLSLYNEFLKYDEELSSKVYEGFSPEDKFFYILFGLSQKTFWFQERHRLLAMNSRFYQMLYGLPRRYSDLPKYFLHIEHKYGCSFPTYNIASMALVWVVTRNTVINFPYQIASSPKMKGVDNKLVNELLQDYVSEYETVRRSTLKARQLYLTPVLRSTQNELLITSAFLIARKAFTNLYWETRRLCLSAGATELNLALGEAFERYVDELLEHYLPNEEYHRLRPSAKRKRADLIVMTKEYQLLIEQKFAMLNISQQDIQFDLERVDSWLLAYVQAARQLEQTENELAQDGRPVVKLILFFDNLYIADGLVKERVAGILKRKGEVPLSLKNVFMISIDEFERLIQVISKNVDVADRVMGEKIIRQYQKNYSKGVEFNQVMDEMSADRNEYIVKMNPFEGEQSDTN